MLLSSVIEFTTNNGDFDKHEPATFAWPINSKIFQMSNLEHVHEKCASGNNEWIPRCDLDN